MLRTVALAGLACLGLETAAHAQNLPRPAPTWAGFYVGAFAGGAWGNAKLSTDVGPLTATSYFSSAANIASVNGSGSGNLDADGAVAGVHVGTNVQQGKLVWGLEVDFGAFNVSGAKTATNVPYPSFAANYSLRTSVDTDWLLTARGRVGWAAATNLLVYATGGMAMSNVTVSSGFSDTAPSSGLGSTSDNTVKVGWTLGGGLEWALSRNWSLRTEYLYVDLGSATAKGSAFCGPSGTAVCTLNNVTPSSVSASADLSAHIARLGISYRF